MCVILDGEKWVKDSLAVIGSAGMSFDIFLNFYISSCEAFRHPLNFWSSPEIYLVYLHPNELLNKSTFMLKIAMWLLIT